MNLETAYAQALFEASHAQGASAQTLTARLRETLHKRGHERLLPRILQALDRRTQQARRQGGVVRIAREQDRAAALAAMRDFAPALAAEASVTIDPALVSGYVLVADARRLDHSANRSLRTLYQRLINSNTTL